MSRRLRWWCAALLLAPMVSVEGQGPPPPPPPPPDSVVVRDTLPLRRDTASTRRDSVAQARDSLSARDSSSARDSLTTTRDTLPKGRDTVLRGRDTTAKGRGADSLQFLPPDSMMQSLLDRKGYTATRYQADTVAFTAAERRINLRGQPAAVMRGGTALAGDTIDYSDAGQLVDVRSRTILVRDPDQGSDVTASGVLRYRLDERRVTATDMRTAAAATSVWFIRSERGGFVSDTVGGTFYGKTAVLTTDPDTVPHYRFLVGEVKQISSNVMVARPAVLYIGEVPVMWIPFLYQDLRKGRRSGLLTPRFGAGELLRNSSSYRRTIENFGYYFALSDYFDAQVSLDWRSGARPSEPDPGWMGVNGELRYAWRDRFLDGRIGASRLAQFRGQQNLALTWMHRQEFSSRSSFDANVNYVTSTSLQRQTALNPAVAVANITSQANYQTQFGPLRASLGGTFRQAPGRDEQQQDFPSLNITSQPIELAPWLTWTPSLNTSTARTIKSDAPTEFTWRYQPRNGVLDSTQIERNLRTTTLGFNSPIKIGNFNINTGIRMADRENAFPEARIVIDPSDTTQRRNVIYARTYLTAVDWDFSMNLPQFLQGSWNLTPNVTLSNVDPAGYWIRSERTGAAFVNQSKRLQYGASVSPTVFALLPGLGAFSRIRHSVTPTIAYTFSPEASVSDAFLGAIGRTRAGYLGALAQNRVSLTLVQNIEAKLRPRRSTEAESDGPAAADDRKIRLLSLQFSAIEYDFERAKATGGSGFATERFGTTVRSDLLPGFDFGIDYSLFQGSVLSDTAVFSPYPESIRASLALSRQANMLSPFAKILGWVTGERPSAEAEADTAPMRSPAMATGRTTGQTSQVAGRSRPAMMEVPSGQGWQANLTYSSTRQRPQSGSNVFNVDPRAECEPLRAQSPLQYEICLRQRTPTQGSPLDFLTTGGGPVFQMPAQASVQGNLSFNLTRLWAAQWQTSFDIQRGEFASQIVSLQRDLKDWRAMFGFSQAANGNFSFNFLITLKPAPDIKLNYDRQTFRAGGFGAH